MYKWIGVLLIFSLSTGCEKDQCKTVEIANGTCALSNDTSLAYQLLLGKWYAKTLYKTYLNSTDYVLECYDGNDYLEFLPNRTINIHGDLYLGLIDSYPDTTIMWELVPADSSYCCMYNKAPILGQSKLNAIEVCQNALYISSHNTGNQYYTFTK